MKKIILGAIGVLVVIVIIAAASGGGNKQNSSTTSSTQSKEEQKASETVAKVGEAVEDSGLAFTVMGVDTASSLGNSYSLRNAQGVFYVVTLKIENKGTETKTVDSSMITLTDSQRRKFDRPIEGQTAKGLSQGKVDLFLQQVQPGLSVTGNIVFDIPKDASGLNLIVKGALFGSGKKIDLGK